MAKKSSKSNKKKKQKARVAQSEKNKKVVSTQVNKKNNAKKIANTKPTTESNTNAKVNTTKKTNPKKPNTTKTTNTKAQVKKGSAKKNVKQNKTKQVAKGKSLPKKVEQVKKVDTKVKDQQPKIEVKKKEKVLKEPKRLRNYWVVILLVLLLVGVIVVAVMNHDTIKDLGKENKDNNDKVTNTPKEEDLEIKYNDCMAMTFENDENVKKYAEELVEALDIESLAFAYQDLESGYYIANNDEVTYYAASTIKMLDALYLYTKARAGEIDLNDTLEYTANVKYDGVTYKYGTQVAIRDLVKLAVSISDNASHLVLLDYIGFNNLKEFGNNLGATTTLTGGDTYGNINASDATKYLKALDEFLKIDDEYSQELYNYLYNANQKYYDVTDDDFIHKYGNYNYYYNDLGIVYGDKNYSIVFLSHFGRDNYQEKFAEYYEIVNNFNIRYSTYKETYCYRQVYEK